MSKFVSFLVGFISGALAGYLVGLLTAPTSGEEVRHEISDRAIELRERAEQRAGRVSESVLSTSGIHEQEEGAPARSTEA